MFDSNRIDATEMVEAYRSLDKRARIGPCPDGMENCVCPFTTFYPHRLGEMPEDFDEMGEWFHLRYGPEYCKGYVRMGNGEIGRPRSARAARGHLDAVAGWLALIEAGLVEGINA